MLQYSPTFPPLASPPPPPQLFDPLHFFHPSLVRSFTHTVAPPTHTHLHTVPPPKSPKWELNSFYVYRPYVIWETTLYPLFIQISFAQRLLIEIQYSSRFLSPEVSCCFNTPIFSLSSRHFFHCAGSLSLLSICPKTAFIKTSSPFKNRIASHILGFVRRIFLFQEAFQLSIELSIRRDSGQSKTFQILGDALRTMCYKNTSINPAILGIFDAIVLLLAIHRVVLFWSPFLEEVETPQKAFAG